jgi:DNA polymerase delta, subunit 4
MTTPRFSDECVLPPIEDMRAKVAELGLSDTGVVDKLVALDAKKLRETQAHLTRFELGGCVMAVVGDEHDELSCEMFASVESLIFSRRYDDRGDADPRQGRERSVCNGARVRVRKLLIKSMLLTRPVFLICHLIHRTKATTTSNSKTTRPKMTTALSYSDPCALPPIKEVRAKAAELGLIDHACVIDRVDPVVEAKRPVVGAKRQIEDTGHLSAKEEETNAIICRFDGDSEFGPRLGITRMQRWERAEKLECNPPLT